MSPGLGRHAQHALRKIFFCFPEVPVPGPPRALRNDLRTPGPFVQVLTLRRRDGATVRRDPLVECAHVRGPEKDPARTRAAVAYVAWFDS